MAIRTFPFSVAEIRENLLVHLNDHDAVDSLKKTQRNFTISREQISNYSRSEEDISSYSLFYMPTDFPKLSMILAQLDHHLIERLKKAKVTVFDIGCGPGTFSFAWSDYFPGSDHSFFFIDQSSIMLEQAKVFSRTLFNLRNTSFTRSVSTTATIDGSDLKIAIFGHSINEMGLNVANDYLKKIDPDLIFMIGPGTPEVFRLFMDWKTGSASKLGYDILYPCLDSSRCPIYSNPKSDDWCHQILRSKLSPDLHQLGQKLSIDRRSVPFVGHIYIKTAMLTESGVANEAGEKFTLVRFLGQTKFSWRFLACPVGSQEIVELEILKKLLTKDQVHQVMSLCVGDRVRFSLVKAVGPNHLRGHII